MSGLGLEPETFRTAVRRSTNWANWCCQEKLLKCDSLLKHVKSVSLCSHILSLTTTFLCHYNSNTLSHLGSCLLPPPPPRYFYKIIQCSTASFNCLCSLQCSKSWNLRLIIKSYSSFMQTRSVSRYWMLERGPELQKEYLFHYLLRWMPCFVLILCKLFFRGSRLKFYRRQYKWAVLDVTDKEALWLAGISHTTLSTWTFFSDWFIWLSACIVIGYLSNFTSVKREKFPKAKQSTLKLRLLLSLFRN